MSWQGLDCSDASNRCSEYNGEYSIFQMFFDKTMGRKELILLGMSQNTDVAGPENYNLRVDLLDLKLLDSGSFENMMVKNLWKFTPSSKAYTKKVS